MATPSSDAIEPPAVGDPGAEPAPPGSDEPSALDEAPIVLPRLDESTSGELAIGPRPASGSGSSTFDIPPGLVVPDPIVRVLSESPAPAEAEPEAEPPNPEAPRDSSTTASGDPLGGFRFDHEASAAARPARAAADRSASGDDVVIEYVNGPNWPMVLLASYASAATLALVWWVILPRFRGERGAEALRAPAAVTERRADRSRTVEPPSPIPADRVVTMGTPLRVGALEITPLDVSRSDVRLRRTALSGVDEQKEDGAEAMALRVRLRNTSDDLVFAPLDEAFVRDRDDGVPESFVQVDGDGRVYLYPLPVDSEWSIVGQEFPDLKPGEAAETRIVTRPDFPPAPSGMTWRLKLRTGLKDTAVVGVRVTGAP